MTTRTLPRVKRKLGPDSHHDVLILGSGFAGSLLACILARHGRRVLLVDRATHPRFAIGESSTPIADTILAALARRYALDEVAALARFGSWRDSHPQLMCGRKRGFSYFAHTSGAAFREAWCGQRSMLVAASASDAVADTHWMRSDVDQFLFQQACRAGAEARQQTTLGKIEPGEPWKVELIDSNGLRQQVTAEWLIDSSGRSAALAAQLGARNRSGTYLHTRSSARFGHVTGLPRLRDYFEANGCSYRAHPFDCDAAAQHHLLEDGWVWMLRFEDGRTSIGRVWNRDRPASPPRRDGSLAERLDVDDYPTLRELVDQAAVCAPAGGLVDSGPLQRWIQPMTGRRWLALPSTTISIDPLHSNGIAHSLSGVEHAARILLSDDPVRQEHRRRWYERQVRREARLMDLLVDGCYRAMPRFDLLASFSALYFAAAISYEQRRVSTVDAGPVEGASGDLPALWSADVPGLVRLVREAHHRVALLGSDPEARSADVAAFTGWLRAALAPWNTAGLLDPAAQNMYAYTAANK